MTEGNIITFPKNKIIREPVQSIEEIEKLKARGTQNFADALIQDVAENILGEFGSVGLNMETNNFAKDFQFLVHILSATVYRSMNIDHPLHNVIDNQINFVEEVDTSE